MNYDEPSAPRKTRGARMPNQPKTPQRAIRIEDDLWKAAQELAASKGTTVSELVRQALRRATKSRK